ncbi:DUF5906 domain-containing protein [Acidisphaera sp. L21]|uniref:DUF5906 domain-containing protein n=1 Tax=Acidisphaera sp. L21 TaxID=1641851 RepID=UPI00131CAB23|nr:DUF5906 domain-containing protein [Acidisphaera sp. L21]
MMKYPLDDIEQAVIGVAAGAPADSSTLRSAASQPGKPSALSSGKMSPALANKSLPDLTAAARAGGRARFDFSKLTSDQQNNLLAALFHWPGISALADADRDLWRNLVFSGAHAGYLGATNAYTIALAWSMSGTKFVSEADFASDWNSFGPAKGITVGTVIKTAISTGFDLGPYLTAQQISAATGGTGPTAARPASASASSIAVATTVVMPPAWNTLPTIMNEGVAGALLNRFVGFARDFGSGPSYFRRAPDGSPHPMTRTDGADLLAPYRVKVGSGDTAKLVPAWNYWSNWDGRYTVDVVAYDPENKLHARGQVVENTWRGFAIMARPGNWPLIEQHLHDVLCRGNAAHYNYLVRWLASIVQRPGTSPQVVVVARSIKEGTGKSTAAGLLLRMFGRHGHSATTIDEIIGEFNGVLQDKSFVSLDEAAFPGDHKAAARFRAAVTSNTIAINRKGKDRFVVSNSVAYFITSNSQWVVPAGADARRFFVLDVTELRDRAYFDALYAEIEGGGIEAFLHALLSLDLSAFNVRDVPVTKGLQQQQRLSADDITRWIEDAVAGRVLVVGMNGGGFGQTISGPALHTAFLEWAKAQNVRKPAGASVFGRALATLGCVRGSGNNPPMWTVPDGLTLLQASHARAGIRQITP